MYSLRVIGAVVAGAPPGRAVVAVAAKAAQQMVAAAAAAHSTESELPTICCWFPLARHHEIGSGRSGDVAHLARQTRPVAAS